MKKAIGRLVSGIFSEFNGQVLADTFDLLFIRAPFPQLIRLERPERMQVSMISASQQCSKDNASATGQLDLLARQVIFVQPALS